jgi:hypothetical protein
MRIKIFKTIALAASLLFLSNCNYLKKYGGNNDGARIVARVNNEYLYVSDLDALTVGKSGEDSAKIVTAYTESWVKKKLLLQKAQEYIPADDAGISRKVEEYRESLILYEYEKELIRKKMQRAVKDEEINEFYEKNKNNFALENDVYKINFIIISPNAEEFDKIKQLIAKSKTEEDFQALEGYCKAFAKSYNLGDGEWKTTESLKSDFVLNTEKPDILSTSNKFKEYQSGELLYFIKILEKRSKGEVTPLEFVQVQIKEMLFNKKKVALIENIYNQIYEDGIANKEVEVFVK